MRAIDPPWRVMAIVSVALAMVAQDPEQFSLMSVEAGKSGSKLRGKTMMPKGFGFELHPELRGWCAENGYPAPNQQTYAMAAFIDYATTRGEKYKDWAATFRTWARNEIAYRKYPPDPVWPPGHPGAPISPDGGMRMNGSRAFGNLRRGGMTGMTKGEAALDHNRAVMDAAGDRLGGPLAAAGVRPVHRG